MKALLFFHFRVGIRIAIRSFVPLFSAILALIMLQMYPAAVVASIAKSAFTPSPNIGDVALIAALAFALPLWAAPRLANGLNGWLRHLSISGVSNRRGLTLGLLVAQMPLAVALVMLGLAAHGQGLPVWRASLRWTMVMFAAALASTPAKRSLFSSPVSVLAAMLALFGGWSQMLASAGLLLAADFFAGAVSEKGQRRRWRAAGPLFDFRIAWRALGWRISSAYLAGFAALAAAALFISNNELTGALAAGSARFGGGMACLLCISSLAETLAVRRPVWPLARSFPRSSAQRIASDALFLGAHVLPLAGLVALHDGRSAAMVAAVLPFYCLRAAGHMRRIPDRRTGSGTFLAEGSLAAALLALLPWTAPVSLAAAIPAFLSAREVERRQKVTRWQELHHASAGDTLSWGEQ